MSDLQCHARLIVVNPPGFADPARLASALARERVAAVYTAVDVAGSGPVKTLADDLGAPTYRGDDELADTGSGFQQIADLHRGETVVIVRGGQEPMPVLLLVDSDGVTSRPFP